MLLRITRRIPRILRRFQVAAHVPVSLLPRVPYEMQGNRKKPILSVRRLADNDDSDGNSLQPLEPPAPFSPVLALGVSRRPLFPGFFKTVVIRDPAMIRAVHDAMLGHQPYIVSVLLKDDESEADTVRSIDEIHQVGVFCQILGVQPSPSTQHMATLLSGESSEALPPLTVVLFPLQRVKITNVMLATGETGEEIAVPESPHSFLLVPPHLRRGKRRIIADFEAPSLVENILLKEGAYARNKSMIRALTSEIVAVLKDISALNPIFRDQISAFSMSQASSTIFDDPAKLADFSAAISGGSEPLELQAVLESMDVEDRLQKALVVLKKELLNAQLQEKLSKDVDSKIHKRQREFYLMEQLRAIKKELGMDHASDGGKDKLLEKFKERIDALGGTTALPPTVAAVIEEETQKLTSIDPMSSEFNVSRNYLDWLTCLPWNLTTKEIFDIAAARKVLDADHYGLKDVKDRILEFIAVNKLRNGAVQGKILCFCGPPGVGKTSIGRSIASALNRNFFRFSVGGLSDVAEIKGHRRTYVGAMPGKIVQALKKVKSENPLILIDEIDKLARYTTSGASGGGDPSSALLELLDPEQNFAFLDHYLDVPIDLSKVLFVCTANVVENIPGPLLDRMEVLTLSGYVSEEKMAIATQYLVPQAIDATGLKGLPVSVSSTALDELIRHYCRESGVRSLKKFIEKITRKVAFKITEHAPQDKLRPEGLESIDAIEVDAKNLCEFVGRPPFPNERIFDDPPIGVVMGLAWTSMGGSALYIESVLHGTSEKEPTLLRTGQLGHVMKESCSIAHTFSRAFVAKNFKESADILDKGRVHLHVPEGATPKDGPSAGVTMATSLISLALKRKVAGTIAMTGELTLTGQVLKIGGLKEKVIAAKRSGIKTVIFPKSNESDWVELPDYICAGIEPVFAETYQDVFNVCFK